jgi:K+-transporting ATPase ATPase A chain
MTAQGWFTFIFLGVLLVISTPILGNYMAKVYTGQKVIGDRIAGPVERLIFRATGIDPEGEQRWSTYAVSLLIFSLVGVLLLYAELRFQQHLPFNRGHVTTGNGFGPGAAFNVAISFLTNTNWQIYTGETAASAFTNFFGLVLQQFLSAAVGLAVVIALIRGLTRRRSRTLGSFWVDVTKSVTRILLPLSIVFAVVLMSQGAIDGFGKPVTAPTIAAVATHTTKTAAGQETYVPQPDASQSAIEMLGDNGGGVYNTNNSHPWEDPNAFTFVFLSWITLMIAFALPWTFGRMVGSLKQGMAVLASMLALFTAGAIFTYVMEARGNNKLNVAGVTQAASANQAGGNLEGKDVRFGVAASALQANAITTTSSGGYGSSLDSYTPLAGGTDLTNMLLGEVSPGGTGSGLYGKLILALLSVFIAGLMVGRTPEYLGKKIQSAEMKLVVIYIVAVPLVILVFAAIAIVTNNATAKLGNGGAHGLTEMVYAYTSAANNNGSAFPGITTETTWYEVTMGIAMFLGRFAIIIPALAIGGSLGRKRFVPATAGTFRTDTPLFAGLLVAVTVILVGLTYFPILALGPIVEHLSGHF